MPAFDLNKGTGRRYDRLSHFEKSYVEAMFFTNCDSGDDDENKANKLGVDRLTRESLRAIHDDCESFLNSRANGKTVREWIALAEDSDGMGNAGHDFWLTRQGHGAGFWDGDWPDEIGKALTVAAHAMGESNVFFQGGWIHVQ